MLSTPGVIAMVVADLYDPPLLFQPARLSQCPDQTLLLPVFMERSAMAQLTGPDAEGAQASSPDNAKALLPGCCHSASCSLPHFYSQPRALDTHM